MQNNFEDRAKLLGDLEARATREAELRASHIVALSMFVENLRVEMGPDYHIPYFDPWDGGVAAEALFLLEAPGAKAKSSGFISRNNPDETAKNFFNLNNDAGIARRRTISWNIVPWYLGSVSRIRAANSSDVEAGIRSLESLLDLLPQLRAIVLIGRKAQRGSQHITKLRPKVKLFESPHPSPLFVNKSPHENREKIRGVLRSVADYLDTPSGEPQ